MEFFRIRYCSGRFDVEFLTESGSLLLPLRKTDEAIGSKADCEYPPGTIEERYMKLDNMFKR